MKTRPLETVLRELRAPGEEASLDRARGPLRRAYIEREPVPQPARRPWRLALGAVALVVIAAAATPPGWAVLGSIRDAVGREKVVGVESARPLLLDLPARGRLLVASRSGVWIVNGNGGKRRLGAYEDAAWSPHGLFVVATRDHELATLSPDGSVRWTLPSSSLVRDARWSPSGLRIAYRSGRALRLVDGNGTDDAELVHRVAPVAPAWRGDTLAFIAPNGAVRVVQAATGRASQVSAPGAMPVGLAWSGRDLVVLDRHAVRVFRDGRRPARVGLGRRIGVSLDTSAGGIAVVAFDPVTRRSELLTIEGATAQTVFAGAGRFGAVEWSPDGRWLLLAWPSAGQWVFIRSAGVQRIEAVSNLARQFRSPGATPEPLGWIL
jgi:hypothetical protein